MGGRRACLRIRAAPAAPRAPAPGDPRARRERRHRPVKGQRAHRVSAIPDLQVQLRRAKHARAQAPGHRRAWRRRRVLRSSDVPARVTAPGPCPIPEAMNEPPLRRGWTTGTCAAAAAKAAYAALLTGEFPDPVEVSLPRGGRPSFSLAVKRQEADRATAGVIKDAGDDPDVTHGALVLATVRAGTPGSSVIFRAGEGVGTVTRPGLPLPPGEPAINPAPRRMIREAVTEVAAAANVACDIEIEIAIPG